MNETQGTRKIELIIRESDDLGLKTELVFASIEQAQAFFRGEI
jgi:hypothetical protein